MTTVLALDVGGSKTHGILDRDGAVVAEAVGGAANPSSMGASESARQLARVVDDLLADGSTVDAVCAGVAGADSPAARERVRVAVEHRLPGVPVHVVHDAELVLAAAELREGIVLVSGTGSAAWGRAASGATARAGGWGYLLGDEGSGYGIARAAVQHVLARADEGLPVDELGVAFLAACGLADPAALLDAFYADPTRRAWASRAVTVFELAARGDRAAVAVVETAAAELVRSAANVGNRLGLRHPVVMAGGLAHHQPLLVTTVRAQLASLGFVDVRVLAGDPVHGAARLAHAFVDRALAGRA